MTVRRKIKEVPRPGGADGPLGTMRREFLRGRDGAKASRLPPRKLSLFTESLLIPADASGAYRPHPQATTKLVPGSPSLKGYGKSPFCFDMAEKPMVNLLLFRTGTFLPEN
jgi:hypothetical protein